jgi:hypothetical protein
MDAPPGTGIMMQQTSVHHKRFNFLSKIPLVLFLETYYDFTFVPYRFFRKSSKPPKKPQARRLKLFEIYRFADKLDVFLMIIGTIAG